jgi:hypothetical protein
MEKREFLGATDLKPTLQLMPHRSLMTTLASLVSDGITY